MNRIRERIETTIHGTGRRRITAADTVLHLLSLAYGGSVRLWEYGFRRGLLSARRLPCAVVSIGNITVGGTGKTPMTVHVARHARDLGYRTVVLSRGYGGEDERTGGIVSDGRSLLMGPDRAGDEPVMMAGQLRDVPVIVGRDRYGGGIRAMTHFRPDILVLDDGFQHLSLMRDLDLVLLDSRNPAGNGHLLPRGPLREPLTALDRGDAFVLTRCEGRADEGKATLPSAFRAMEYPIHRRPLFRSFHTPRVRKVIRGSGDAIAEQNPVPPAEGIDRLENRLVWAFSGVARNDDFRSTVEALGCRLTGFKGYPDHYPYGPKDIEAIKRMSGESGAEMILTTEKDSVRIPDSTTWPLDMVVVGIDVAFPDDGTGAGAFDDFLGGRLKTLIEPKPNPK